MKILIVDDVPGWIRFHRSNLEYLNIENLEIDTATSAGEALNKIEVSVDKPYNAIFTDLQMESNYLPKLAGEWLIEQIAKRHKVNYLSKFTARNSDAQIYRQFI